MNNVIMATATGEEHGLVNTIPNSIPFNDFKHMSPANKLKLEKEKKEDSRVVKAEYMNSRGRHERLTKPYCRYAGDPIQTYHLIPGKVYELPMGFIKEVNDEDKKLPVRKDLVSVDGKSVNRDEQPLDRDQEGEWIHKLLPVGF